MWTIEAPLLAAVVFMLFVGAALMGWWLARLTLDDIPSEHPEASDSAASGGKREEEPPRSVLVEAWIVPRNHAQGDPVGRPKPPESPKSRELCLRGAPLASLRIDHNE